MTTGRASCSRRVDYHPTTSLQPSRLHPKKKSPADAELGAKISQTRWTKTDVIILTLDIVPIIFRGSISAYLNIPLLFNGFLAPYVAAKLLPIDFRWIFRIGGIMSAVSVTIVLIGVSRGLKRGGSSRTVTTSLRWANVVKTAKELDVVGLCTITLGTVGILVPLNLNSSFEGGWNSPYIIGPLIAGILLMIFFFYHEAKLASHPVIPFRLLRNRTVLGGLLVTFSLYMAGNAAIYWFNPYLQVTKFTSLDVAGYIQYGYTAGFAVGTVIAGWGMQWTKRYRGWMWAGIIGFTLAMGLLINAKGRDTGLVELGLVQGLAGFGSGLASMAASIGLQGSLDHVDLAIGVTMKDFVVFYGGAMGVAFGGSLWNRVLPTILRSRVAADPTLVLDVDSVVANLFYITFLGPREVMVVQDAYAETQRYASILGLCLSLLGWAVL
ncbi:major facilitator superfamily domain-containing protein [Chytridium lagenaria]|nr:major facilitator superfamily domain-containing protein [Chytridium lagenaria]